MITSKRNMTTNLDHYSCINYSLMYEIETENVSDNFNENKELFDFTNYSAGSKYYDDSNTLVAGKVKDEMVGLAIKEVFSSKQKMYSFLVSSSSEYKKAKSVNENVVVKISYDKYKDVLMKKK